MLGRAVAEHAVVAEPGPRRRCAGRAASAAGAAAARRAQPDPAMGLHDEVIVAAAAGP